MTTDPEAKEAEALYDELQALLTNQRFSSVGFALTMAVAGFLAEVAASEGEERGAKSVDLFCEQVRKLYAIRPRSLRRDVQ